MEARVSELECEVEELSEEVRGLRHELRQLKRLVSRRLSGGDEDVASVASGFSGVVGGSTFGAESNGSYSVVAELPAACVIGCDTQSLAGPTCLPVSTGSGLVASPPVNSVRPTISPDLGTVQAPISLSPPTTSGLDSNWVSGESTWSQRESVCEQIARFVVKALNNEYHGTSGRDKINIPSSVWIVFRDFNGQRHNPVLVYNRFSYCSAVVKRGGNNLGKSVFVGLPTVGEAKRVVGLAGLLWPQSAQQ